MYVIKTGSYVIGTAPGRKECKKFRHAGGIMRTGIGKIMVGLFLKHSG